MIFCFTLLDFELKNFTFALKMLYLVSLHRGDKLRIFLICSIPHWKISALTLARASTKMLHSYCISETNLAFLLCTEISNKTSAVGNLSAFVNKQSQGSASPVATRAGAGPRPNGCPEFAQETFRHVQK